MSELRIVEPPEGVQAVAWLIWNDGDYYGPDLVTIMPTKEAAVAWLNSRLATNRWYEPGRYGSFYVEGLAAGAEPEGHSDLLHESSAAEADALMAIWLVERSRT